MSTTFQDSLTSYAALPPETPAPIASRVAELREYVRDAIEASAPATPELITINRQLCDLEAQLGIAAPVSFPTSALLPMTDICNARCRFCAYTPEIVNGWSVGLDAVKRMDWLKFVEQVAFGLGLGEPFATKGLIEMLQYWRESAPFTKTWATTNGSLIAARHIEQMVGYVSHLFISLNAAAPATYERVMPPLKWDKTLGNLRALRDAKVKAGTHLPALYLSYVISVENAEEAPTLPSLAVELGATHIVWYHAVPTTSPYLDYLYPETHHLSFHPALYNRVRAETQAECERLGVIFWAPPPFSEAPALSAEFAYGGNAPGTCHMPWHELLATNIEHKVQVCCGFGTPHFPTFTWPSARRFHEEVWNTPAMVHMRATINKPEELPICALCRRTDKNSPQERRNLLVSLSESHEILLQVTRRAEMSA